MEEQNLKQNMLMEKGRNDPKGDGRNEKKYEGNFGGCMRDKDTSGV